MTRSIRVGRSVGLSVGRYVIIFWKGSRIHFHAPFGALVNVQGQRLRICIIFVINFLKLTFFIEYFVRQSVYLWIIARLFRISWKPFMIQGNSNQSGKKFMLYRVLIKYCVFFEDFKIFRTFAFLCFLSVSVCVCTHTRQVEQQRYSRKGRVQKIHNIVRKNTIFNEYPVVCNPFFSFTDASINCAADSSCYWQLFINRIRDEDRLSGQTQERSFHGKREEGKIHKYGHKDR